MSQKTIKRVFTRKSKLFLVLASMILALSCKNPLGDESGGSGGAGGGGSGGQTITNKDGKVFPAWYLTEQQQQQNFSIGPKILFDTKGSGQGSQQYRIPAIIVADNGNIIAIADNRYNHGGDIGAVEKLMDIVYKVSKDGGYNWSGEKIMGDKSTSFAYTEAKNKGDALVFKANDGDLVCMAVSGGGFANATDKTPSRMVRSVSKDNGENWSNWEEVGTTLIQKIKTQHGKPKAFASSGRGLTLKDGTFVAAMSAQNTAGNTIIIYTYSKNKGQTWEYGSAIENSGGNGVINEPKVIAELDDGKLLMSVRNASGTGSQSGFTQTKNRMYAISTSTGANCTWPTSLSAWDFRCGNVDAEGVVWTRNGIEDKTRIIHIQGGPNYRRGLRLFLSTEEGKTDNSWREAKVILGDATGASYASLDVCGDGTVVTLAEEYSPNGQYYDIVFRRYNMKAITQEVYKTEWYKEIK